jgi:two-component system chemotaxis sensor kinase CheA
MQSFISGRRETAMDDLLHHFIIEARELIQQATDDLIALERDPDVMSRVDSAFRAVHTLKGSVGLFDFAPMGLALHAAEDLLGSIRAGQGSADSDVIDSLLQCIAQAERWVDVIEKTGHLPSGAAEEGYRLARALRAQLDEAPDLSTSEIPQGDIGWIEDLMNRSADAAALRAQKIPLVAIRYIPRADCFFTGDDPIAILGAVPDLVAVHLSNRDPWAPIAEMDPFSCNLVVEALSRAELDAVKATFRFVPDQVTIHEIARSDTGHVPAAGPGSGENSVPADTGAGAGSRTLRIDAFRIDRLADLVGELVIAKNALAHLAGQAGNGLDQKELAQGLLSSQAAIDRLVAEMHRAVMDVRLMPMREIFRRFPRAARDIAGQLNKTIDFSMEGEDVEADKSVVEGLFEPLLHVLRNAIGHGAEPEQLRLEAGKPANTRIVLRARRAGDRVIVEVEDDGRGIDPDAIRRAAYERGVALKDDLGQMSDEEVVDLIFAPGFSTASEITDMSGRGVGMDAVRSAVERLSGQAGVRSSLGRGTTIHLSLPLTVAMTRIMTVRASEGLYGIPLDGIVETAFVSNGRILPVGDGEAFVLRDRTLPLIWLSDLLELPGKGEVSSNVKVVVMAMGDELVGLAVDGFAERMDVLMRPMSGLLAGMPGVMGTTLLGNGNVLMILDIPELIG